jgi:hypothetical protein
MNYFSGTPIIKGEKLDMLSCNQHQDRYYQTSSMYGRARRRRMIQLVYHFKSVKALPMTRLCDEATD